MGLLDNLLSNVNRLASGNIPENLLNKIPGMDKIAALKNAAGNSTKTFTFNALPTSVEALKALPEASLQDVYAVAALSLLALTRFEADRNASVAMLNFLKGPEPLSNKDLQMISDRFMDGTFYKVNSFFEGATPENNYTPARPWQVKVSSNPYSFENENWATLYLTSGGADSPRPVRLRKKPSTGQWFLVEIQYLSDVRPPVGRDKWA